MTARMVNLEEIGDRPPVSSGKTVKVGLDALRGLQVVLQVQLGEVEMSLGEVTSLTEGAVVKLDRLANEAVDILLDGCVIAHGVIVAVDDNFGVQITDVPTAE